MGSGITGRATHWDSQARRAGAHARRAWFRRGAVQTMCAVIVPNPSIVPSKWSPLFTAPTPSGVPV